MRHLDNFRLSMRHLGFQDQQNAVPVNPGQVAAGSRNERISNGYRTLVQSRESSQERFSYILPPCFGCISASSGQGVFLVKTRSTDTPADRFELYI